MTFGGSLGRNARFADSKRDSKPRLCPADLRGLGGKCVCVAPCHCPIDQLRLKTTSEVILFPEFNSNLTEVILKNNL